MLYFCLPAQHFSPFCSSLAPRRWRSPSRRTWATKVKFCFKTLRLSGRRTFSLSQVSDKVEESKEMCSYNSLVGISCFNSVSTLKLWRGTFFIFCSGECDLCETRKDWWNALLASATSWSGAFSWLHQLPISSTATQQVRKEHCCLFLSLRWVCLATLATRRSSSWSSPTTRLRHSKGLRQVEMKNL